MVDAESLVVVVPSLQVIVARSTLTTVLVPGVVIAVVVCLAIV